MNGKERGGEAHTWAGDRREAERMTVERVCCCYCYFQECGSGDGKEDWEKVYSAQRIKFPLILFPKDLNICISTIPGITQH